MYKFIYSLFVYRFLKFLFLIDVYKVIFTGKKLIYLSFIRLEH